MDNKTVRDFVEINPNIVYRKETSIPGVYLLKYKNRVFYDNLWHVSPVLLECRGTLVDEDYNVVSRPFTKVFNYGENGTTMDDETVCEVHEKINGFMAAVCLHKGEIIVSTTGSTDSEFASMARENLEPYMAKIKDWLTRNQPNVTFIFEIVDSRDKHIIDEAPGVYLIGARTNYWDSSANLLKDSAWRDIYTKALGVRNVESYFVKFRTVKRMAKESQCEGYMVYDVFSKTVLKIKSPFYLMSKFLARKHVDKLINLFKDQRELRSIVDEEFYPVIDYINGDFDNFLKADEQERLNIIRKFIYGVA